MLAIVVGAMGLRVRAQTTMAEPATDTSAQASPVRKLPDVPAVDKSAQASPAAGPKARRTGGGMRFAVGTSVPIRLDVEVRSGQVHNGQTVMGVLAGPVAAARLTTASTGRGAQRVPGAPKVLPEGTPVALTVVATTAAGQLSSAGEISLTLTAVGGSAVATDVQSFAGKAGHKDLPDSAPARGTEAALAAGTALQFTVQGDVVTRAVPQAVMGGGPGSLQRMP